MKGKLQVVVAFCFSAMSLLTSEAGADEGKPLMVQSSNGEDVSLLTVERKRIWRDDFGNESRAKAGQEWVVFRTRFTSRQNRIHHSPLELVDAAGNKLPPFSPEEISWEAVPLPGQKPATPIVELGIDEIVPIVFSVPEGTALQSLRIGELSFPLDQLANPQPRPDSKGAVVRGRVLRGQYVAVAEPLADTQVALIKYPETEKQPGGKGKKGKKGDDQQLLFLPIASETRTDDQGKFTFGEVAPGRYLLAVTVTFGMSTGMQNVKSEGKDVVIEIRSESEIAEITVLVEKDRLQGLIERKGG